MTSAFSSASARRYRFRLFASARMTRSVSRLNSAAPYNTHACPPISRARTRCSRIEERTLRIGFGIKRTSQNQERLPESLALHPTFGRTQRVPLCPLRTHQLFSLNHGATIGNISFAFNPALLAYNPRTRVLARAGNDSASASDGAAPPSSHVRGDGIQSLHNARRCHHQSPHASPGPNRHTPSVHAERTSVTGGRAYPRAETGKASPPTSRASRPTPAPTASCFAPSPASSSRRLACPRPGTPAIRRHNRQ